MLERSLDSQYNQRIAKTVSPGQANQCPVAIDRHTQIGVSDEQDMKSPRTELLIPRAAQLAYR